MSEELLPLFPLQVVLFPNSILPLHIFEDRYKQLVIECTKEKKAFGINLVQDNEIARIGCTAVVTGILKKYDDGRMDILVQGQQRYCLQRIVTSSMLYSVGNIEYEPDADEAIDVKLAEETVALHNDLVVLVYRDKSYMIECNAESPSVSFKIAQKAGMELAQRQKLLELNSENERLTMLREYFLQVIPKLEHLGEVERIIKSDGYIVN